MSRPSRSPRARFIPRCSGLEPRELLSGFAAPSAHVHVARHHPIGARPALSGQGFNNVLSTREATSANSTQRVDAAFQAFTQNYLGIPLNQQGVPPAQPGSSGSGTTPTGTNNGSPGTGTPQGPPLLSTYVPIGTLPADRSLDGFLAQLTDQVSLALATYKPTTTRVLPSLRDAPKYTPQANQALIPFAQQQIAQMGQTIRANPPAYDANGTLVNAEPLLGAVNTAFNAILHAVAENTAHPHLFTRPSDFYINPQVQFKLPYATAPIDAGPGFFLRGPGGVPLSGGGHRRR